MGVLGSGRIQLRRFAPRGASSARSSSRTCSRSRSAPPTSCYFQLDEALAGARVNPEYFPDLPEGFEEALVPLVIGDPGIEAARIQG